MNRDGVLGHLPLRIDEDLKVVFLGALHDAAVKRHAADFNNAVAAFGIEARGFGIKRNQTISGGHKVHPWEKRKIGKREKL